MAKKYIDFFPCQMCGGRLCVIGRTPEVVESNPVVRRIRECDKCGHRVATHETIYWPETPRPRRFRVPRHKG